ncbi:MAG: hypothetical protein Q8M37_00690 [Nevskia sp.]|nr:hypothetical protein [Nevskia sp.]
MPSILLKNLPENLHRSLKARAARNHRSLNKEAISLLEAGLASASSSDAGAAQDPFEALLAAGDKMRAEGVDFAAWAANSRDVWR